MDRELSRRSVLAGFGAVMGGLAGCGQAPAATPTPSSPIVETAFDGPDLVVSLRDDHDVSRLNLIDPDGELFAATAVAVGETTSRLEILRIEPGSRMKHYTPGAHTLVAVSETEEDSIELQMVPSLRVVDVEQYRSGSEASDLGRLAVTVENVGSGPTWVYEIAYVGSPNTFANNSLGTDPGITILASPNMPEELPFGPGESKSYVGDSYPLVFPENEFEICDGSSNFQILVGISSGQIIEIEVVSALAGDTTAVGISNGFICSNVELEISNWNTLPKTNHRGSI